jgi:hypothetical protein
LCVTHMWSESCGEAQGTCRHWQTAWGETVTCISQARAPFCVTAQADSDGISWESWGYFRVWTSVGTVRILHYNDMCIA